MLLLTRYTYTKGDDPDKSLTVEIIVSEEFDDELSLKEMEAKSQVKTKEFKKLVKKTVNECEEAVANVTSQRILDTREPFPRTETKTKLLPSME